MSFFGRILQNMANELIVKRLANSPTFQRFAYKSVTGVRAPPSPAPRAATRSPGVIAAAARPPRFRAPAHPLSARR